MNGSAGSILVVDDEAAMGETLALGLARRGFHAEFVTGAGSCLDRLAAADFDAVLTDLRMPSTDGLSLCVSARSIRPDVPVVVMTAFGSLEVAVDAMRAGAYDFMTKPFDLELAEIVLARAVEHRRLCTELKRLRARVEPGGEASGLIGESDAMTRLGDLLARIRDSGLGVLVSGESGTGKELVARALHVQSNRARGPFVPINCAALPEPLLESELFGHVKGAFTDARSGRKGLFAEAAGGTLFLDEVGELPQGMQAKLLRVLQEQRVRPVGSDQEVAVDARIVAATNRDLEALIAEGSFREDLYFRLAVIEVVVPPLRAREGDVLLLAEHFLRRAAAQAGKPVLSLSNEAARVLLRHSWPGNVRELENCIARAVALARFDAITPDDLPERVQRAREVVSGEEGTQLLTLEEVERHHIERVLHALGGQRTEAARVLGLDRKTLYRKLARWGSA